MNGRPPRPGELTAGKIQDPNNRLALEQRMVIERLEDGSYCVSVLLPEIELHANSGNMRQRVSRCMAADREELVSRINEWCNEHSDLAGSLQVLSPPENIEGQ